MNIGVMGFGNLGQAFVNGLIGQGIAKPDEIGICAKSSETMEKAEYLYGVDTFKDINALVKWADIVFLAVKGNVFNKLHNIDKKLFKNKIVVSFMAGVTIDNIKRIIGDKAYICRAMPTLSIAKGKGIIGYTNEKNQNNNVVKEILGKMGYVFVVEEKDIEKIMAYSACGLGFAAYILNAYLNAGLKLGFDVKTSEKIVANIFTNAIETSNYLETVSKVATKGGATEQGINLFKSKDLDRIIYDAVRLAYERMI